MKMPEVLPSEFISGIKEVSIDASSIIYFLKVGILGYAAAEIHLVSSRQIIEEVRWPHLPVQGFIVENYNLTNDETIVELALNRKIPVVSEDREVLKNAETKGLNYYNTLMILNYLLMKKRIGNSEYPEYLKRLIDVSHYSRDILDYGARIRELVLSFYQ